MADISLAPDSTHRTNAPRTGAASGPPSPGLASTCEHHRGQIPLVASALVGCRRPPRQPSSAYGCDPTVAIRKANGNGGAPPLASSCARSHARYSARLGPAQAPPNSSCPETHRLQAGRRGSCCAGPMPAPAPRGRTRGCIYAGAAYPVPHVVIRAVHLERRVRVGDGPSAEFGGRRLCGPLPTFSMGCGRESTR